MSRLVPSRRIGAALALVVISCAGKVSLSGAPTDAPALAVPALLAHASEYVDEYQSQLTYLTAKESSTQKRFGARRRVLGERSLRGEMFLAFVPESRQWVAVHDVASVDGQAVPDRDDLQVLLRDASAVAVARQLKDRNARFNIGSVVRNFNEPTFALQVLSAENAPRFRFDRKNITRDASGVTLATLQFKEIEGPTLVAGPEGRRIPSFGELVLEAETGRVRQTTIGFKESGVGGRMTTTYQTSATLGLLVPATMTETWEANGETIVVDSRYDGFRRFEVVSRIR
jgi:hypothetical protein